MKKVALITDTHAGCRNDSKIFLEHSINFFRKQFFPYLIENKITKVIHLGDIFDKRKQINVYTLHIWKEQIFNWLRDNNIQMDILLGNHDTFFKNENNVNSVEELLSHYDNLKIYSNEQVVDLFGTKVHYVPWITPNNLQNVKNILTKSQAEICMGHFEIQGFTAHVGAEVESAWYAHDIFNSFDYVFSGHFHTKATIGNIHYLGSPYQMSWGDFGSKRGFHTFDFQTRTLDFIENKENIFYKINYDDSIDDSNKLLKVNLSFLQNKFVKLIIKNKLKSSLYDLFMQKLYSLNIADLAVVEQEIDKMDANLTVDLAKDTLTIFKDYINEIDIPEKNELFELFKELYTEAINLNVDL